MGKDLKALLDSHLASKEEAEDHKGKLGPSCRRHMEAVTGLEIEMKTISDQHFRGVWRQEATTSKWRRGPRSKQAVEQSVGPQKLTRGQQPVSLAVCNLNLTSLPLAQLFNFFEV